MVFGKKKQAQPAVDPGPWERISKFTVGTVTRNAFRTAKRGEGPLAVRAFSWVEGDVERTPFLYVVPNEPEAPVRAKGFRLYPTPDATGTPVCSVLPDAKAGGRYQVLDAEGVELGAVLRTPVAKRSVQHGWWLEAPGHPEIAARYHWTENTASDVGERAAFQVMKVPFLVLQEVVTLGGSSEGGDTAQPKAPKPATWRSGDTTVITADHQFGARWYAIKAPWLDRRLGFALAVLRDGNRKPAEGATPQ
ncbi:hypothetical protein ACIPYQ_05575 [Streptomyces sp. NPDC090045]|uniref:hypothetical protein n=1 Tax=Streptomyces sp. NPDC090045 TaxID=3365927 RepID=UPI00382733E9